MGSQQGSPKKRVSPSVSPLDALPYMGRLLTSTPRLLERVRDQAEAG